MSAVLTVQLADRSYPIHFLSGLPDAALAERAVHIRGGRGKYAPRKSRILVVTDTNVAPLYAKGVLDALRGRRFEVNLIELPAGEATKSLDTVRQVVDAALSHELGRQDLIIALGGGVVGDIAGFAAAILHRGVRYIQVPTTLLAQVDSAVGGKTGVNHPSGKNLIGAFWQPEAVFASHRVLLTLPERERRCGLAEALKHGFIADAPMVTWARAHAAALAELRPEYTIDLVRRCCAIKAAVVSEDEREAGRRAILNFGHTYGHAYEHVMGYGALTHGEAVALGMVIAARVSEALGVAEPGSVVPVIERALAAVGLAHDPDAEGLPRLKELTAAARTDKKVDGYTVRFVVLPRIGEALIRNLKFGEIMKALAAYEQGGDQEVEP